MLSILRGEEEQKWQAETRVAARREHGKKEEDESRRGRGDTKVGNMDDKKGDRKKK